MYCQDSLKSTLTHQQIWTSSETEKVACTDCGEVTLTRPSASAVNVTPMRPLKICPFADSVSAQPTETASPVENATTSMKAKEIDA